MNNYFDNKEVKTYVYAYITENLVFTDFFFSYKGKAYKKYQTSIVGVEYDQETQLKILDSLTEFFVNKRNHLNKISMCVKIIIEQNEINIKIVDAHKENPEIDFNQWFAEAI